jgi:hypothetical protein
MTTQPIQPVAAVAPPQQPPAALWLRTGVSILFVGLGAGVLAYEKTRHWQDGVTAGILALLAALSNRLAPTPLTPTVAPVATPPTVQDIPPVNKFGVPQ